MTRQVHANGRTVAENYERFFVPAIAAPLAADLVGLAELKPGERVLDLACGTGVMARLAAERVGASGKVAGLDLNPGMLAVARSRTAPGIPIEWHEANAESMPLPDGCFDVVLCQMGLQFVPHRLAALCEMRRVLVAGGRACVSLPGPKPAIFAILAEALARHLGQRAAAFADRVFSLHDIGEIENLMQAAGFRRVDARATEKDLRLPAPRDFLWQYVYSTPLAEAAAHADQRALDALERDVCAGWDEFAVDECLALRLGITIASGVT